MLFQDADQWVAQGLEIDYAAQADSVNSVKAAFERGLAMTLHENLRVFGKIDSVLRPAPEETWKALMTAGGLVKRHTQVSIRHAANRQEDDLSSVPLPFGAIDYFQLPDLAGT